jgi:hypothetical protein
MAATIQSQAASIGANRTYQNPSDPRLVGQYRDNVESMSEQQKSVLSGMPMAPFAPPFSIRGSGG